jgi:hypothetical protein
LNEAVGVTRSASVTVYKRCFMLQRNARALNPISKEIFTRTGDSMMLNAWGPMRPMMPLLFWLPLIFMSALFEIAATPPATDEGLERE